MVTVWLKLTEETFSLKSTYYHQSTMYDILTTNIIYVGRVRFSMLKNSKRKKKWESNSKQVESPDLLDS